MAGTISPVQTVGSVHVSAPLSQFALGYHPQGFIAEQVFSVVTVTKENDLYYKWDKNQAFRLDRTDGLSTVRADGAVAREEGYGTTLDGYTAQERAFRVRVTDRQAANADDVLQLQKNRTRRAQDKILLDEEVAVAKICTTDANYAGSVTNLITNSGVTQWNNASFASLGTVGSGHSLIYAQLLTGVNVIRQNTGGYVPNKIIIPFSAAIVMANDPGMADLQKYVVNLQQAQGDSALGMMVPPKILGMTVLIPRGAYQSAVEGETGALTDIWGKDVILLYEPDAPSTDDLAAGFIFRSRPWSVKVYRNEENSSTYYEPSIVQAEKLVTFDCAYRIKAAVA